MFHTNVEEKNALERFRCRCAQSWTGRGALETVRQVLSEASTAADRML